MSFHISGSESMLHESSSVTSKNSDMKELGDYLEISITWTFSFYLHLSFDNVWDVVNLCNGKTDKMLTNSV